MFSLLYQKIIARHHDAVTFIVLFFFTLSFLISRTFVYLTAIGILPESLDINSNVRGVHVHHLSFGIIILTVAGFLALVFKGKKATHAIAMLYGIGLGIAYDEFGMWLRLQDDYWVRQSYDAVALIFVLLVNIVYFGALWQKLILKTLEITMTLLNLRLLRAQRRKRPN
ncbi:hypothetical protein HY345_02740 [Candidatus Microgenomates bacterium]|nr:hypothetical protein [Candidatus Microgenomates bacterium]